LRYRALGFALSAYFSAALLGGCADGGSSVTRPAGGLPPAVQQNTAAGAETSPSRQTHSGVRRTLSVPQCLGFTGPHAFIGINNSSADAGEYSVVGGGSGNQACDPYDTIAGGEDNWTSGTSGETSGGAFIGGGRSNTLTGDTGYSAIVAGFGGQVSAANSGIVEGTDNSVAASNALVGAGSVNTIAPGGSLGAIVSGGSNNLSGEYGFIGAGIANTVSGEGGFVAAGGYNTVSGEGAVIDGGFNSAASGNFATIPGGYVNSAAGTYSFAAGARASAAQTGTFVWSDGSDGDAILTSSAAYQFLARASGGFTLWTNAGSTVGARLAPGSGTWASASDRNLKADVARIDDAAVLEKVATLPIERWSYKSERGVRHVGPMAQDFYAAFKVGEDDKHITSIDEDGIALAAIKALHAENSQLRRHGDAATSALRAENAALRAELGALRTAQVRHDMLVDRRLERLSVTVAASRER